ncbi:tRNA (cytosine(32)/uridine(32)-2'-O)-methyltransferase TrmJ [Sansalvadorimonas sp. 2012CJ34-2]|uniref:tRNA (cytidine/uridine-2'-O-)-methyltransferase TrmJ n=1 Tax=Parendozoicomonas callyspongiae TaxID=2942213 RepID=A0ABT0PJL8_9GAMM|nr:tRNA (cytosine(32)/uridine(32)-2'-O)-methyltransferase TrmJ [Sansalvadorimonas sp. 2012CJ34-2]MCL6271585.1 tRNA (cytosine(32)/uridine(32)-2'-O)-methyltransferase TrmJ [Sansalvadorimonas sp. 2012CJ34-2]
MLDAIRIVMLRTWHPGNIGSALRAMKTMGLTRLVLVNPEQFPSPEAEAMAAGASDLLDKVEVVSSLEEAIEGCNLVIGTSARSRSFPWPMLTSRSCGEKAVQEARTGEVALVFGQETSGMTNEELQQCHFHVSIDANPEYPVLNVASAVQILCYEVYQASLSDSKLDEEDSVPYPDSRQMEQFYKQLELALGDINFIIRQHPGKIMTKLRRFFNRARPEQEEMNILRGVLSRIRQNAATKESTE